MVSKSTNRMPRTGTGTRIDRRQLLLSIPALALLCDRPEAAESLSRRKRPFSLGFNLVAWDDETNRNPDAWVRALSQVRGLGVTSVVLVPYLLVDGESGELLEVSRFDQPTGPPPDVIAAATYAARDLKMAVSLKPMVEIDNKEGPGAIWRGNLRLESEELATFFGAYTDYVLQYAKLARRAGARRFYIGSELAGLTGSPHAQPYWLRLIEECRATLNGSCLLTYAANYDEYFDVQFWDELDEIGIDAYFPLATTEEARDMGAPSFELILGNWQRLITRLRTFAEIRGQPIHFSEWGVVPFNLTTAQPSEEVPSKTHDPIEALNAFAATLRATAAGGSWLKGLDFWHWSVSEIEDSNYRIEEHGEVANLIRTFAARLAQKDAGGSSWR